MSNRMQELRLPIAPLILVTLVLSASLQLTGCVARVGIAAPPPPRVYVAPPPPPPPVVVAPAVEVDLQANEAPPPLPEYAQPPCPVEGYLWTPGYWSFAAGGYYWVPGTWVQPPRVGVLWAPGYWGFAGGVYGFHAGYWGPHVGFYGGVNYGFGYGGVGFVGGEWRGGHFAYNTAVLHVNTEVIHNTFVDRTVVTTSVGSRASFNGGPGGIHATATAQERAAANEHHFEATSEQMSHEHS